MLKVFVNVMVVMLKDVGKSVKMKITGKTKINEVVMENPESARVLFEAGMGCVGCPMANQETIEQGCLAHGMDKKDIDKLIKELNK